MTLPAWDTTGLLPVGRHSTTLDGLYDRFVQDAPHREHRERLFSAFLLHSKLIASYLPNGGTLWIDGGFTMRKDAPPHDVDVAVLPNDWADVDDWTDQQYIDILGLITLQNVIIEHPWPAMVERVQPVGALLDAFLVPADDEDEWHETWSTVKVDGIVIDGQIKGYAEVTL
ncbi:DUF6932 family protein [Mycolicibacterium fortuitum]|uniref:DUF6932 family protein n=1 Tax=Mycolicibacterium fortuitum TaxID=1766 RepID=UPI0026262C19|nr:hypothetical protein [Mycolicibacterium fortuitum]